jgi:hypothetical protein
MEDENHCKYVSSRGLMKSCDIYGSVFFSGITNVQGYDFSKLTENGTIYICSAAVRDFFVNHIEKINTKFILVSGDCDNTCPTDIFKNQEEFIRFIENEKLIHWFSQNCAGNHPKLTHMPIGLDYHTIANNENHFWGKKCSPAEQEKVLNEIKEQSQMFWNRPSKCYSNFHFFMHTRFGYDRIDALNNIPKELVYYEPDRIARKESWITQSKYAFVISPHGNGYDCHRTWEALCLGCIPIVKTSSLDILFYDLPVLIVNKWTDVTQELLDKTIIEFKTKQFDYERLTLDYWMNKIKSSCK